MLKQITSKLSLAYTKPRTMQYITNMYFSKNNRSMEEMPAYSLFPQHESRILKVRNQFRKGNFLYK
jgi:hypothetical protein